MKFIFFFIFTLFLLTLVHELGHFWVARWLNIKVVRFAIGFGKPLWRWYDKKGTEFVLAWGLLGGYVRLLDEREGKVNEQDLAYAFNRQSIAKRAAVIFAGPAINISFAITLYFIVFSIGIIRPIPIIGEILPNSIAAQALMQPASEIIQVNHKPVTSWRDIAIELLADYRQEALLTIHVKSPKNVFERYQLNTRHWQIDKLHPDLLTSLGIVPYVPSRLLKVNQVIPDSPAAKAGIKAMDRLIAIDRQAVHDPSRFKQLLEQKIGKAASISLQREGKQIERMVNISEKRQWFGVSKPFLGIVLEPLPWPNDKLRLHKASFWASWQLALQAGLQGSYINLLIVKKLLLHEISIHSLGGPISIFEGTSSALRQGFVYYLDFIALLSLSLAIFNLLPIPGLDGAQLMLLGVEKLRGKPLSIALQVLLYRLGMIALVLIMIQTLMNDILRLG